MYNLAIAFSVNRRRQKSDIVLSVFHHLARQSYCISLSVIE